MVVHIFLLLSIMPVKINRLIQIPLDNTPFSKNIIDITVEEPTYEETSKILNTAFSEQMTIFKTSFEDLKETEWYIKTLRIAEFAKWLLTKSAIAKPALVEYKKYCELNKS